MMNFLFETLRLGLKNLRLHKLRSLLTALGIIFGVAAVIIMVAIGEGTKQAALEQLQKLGAKNILLRSVRPPESNEASGRTQRVLEFGIKRVDLERLKTLPGLKRIVAMRDTEQKVIFGDSRALANAIATTPDVFGVINLQLDRGELFNQMQFDNGEQVCVLGSLAARQIFPYQDPIGQYVQIGTTNMSTLMCKVVGVLEPTGLRPGSDSAGIMNRDIDQDVYFPLSIADRAFGDLVMKRTAGSMERKNVQLTEIWLQADRVEDVERLALQAENVLRIGHPGLKDVNVKAPISILRAAEEQQKMFNFILVGIASFSLVVGGIGIMNIMLATVTERTKEIGIRRALGAKQKHITLQFLIETTVISLTGGLIGIALGVSAATILPTIVQLFTSGTRYPTSITTWSVVGSFAISGIIGIGFGLYPAVKAAQMNPIEALRHE